MADKTLYSAAYGEEYHLWPTAARGAWMLIALDFALGRHAARRPGWIRVR
jgi:hypothetical protein